METRTKRLGRLIKTISNNPGITLQHLCTLLARSGYPVSERTIAKDVLALKEEYGLLPARPRLRQGYQLSDMVTVADGECALVADAVLALAITLGDPEATEVAHRLLAAMSAREGPPPSRRVSRRLIGQKVIVEGTDTSRHLERLVMSAIHQHLRMRFRYRSPRTTGEMSITAYPLFKIFYERAWYVIVRDQKTGGYYPCRMDRIVEATIIKGTVNQSFAEHVADASYLIACGWGMTFPKSRADLERLTEVPLTVVRFDSSVASYILEGKRRHPFASVQRARDGSGDVLFSIRLLDNWEFAHWVRSFGSAARFIAPPEIVDRERAEVLRTARNYGCDVKIQAD